MLFYPFMKIRPYPDGHGEKTDNQGTINPTQSRCR